MPTYTYQCENCGHRFNLYHSISDDTTKFCPICEQRAKRMIGGGSGINIKGSGSYQPVSVPSAPRSTGFT